MQSRYRARYTNTLSKSDPSSTPLTNLVEQSQHRAHETTSMLPATRRRGAFSQSSRRHRRGHHAAGGRTGSVCSCLSSPAAIVVVLSVTLLCLLLRQSQSMSRLSFGRASDAYISRGSRQRLHSSETHTSHQRRKAHTHHRHHRHHRRMRGVLHGRGNPDLPREPTPATASVRRQRQRPSARSASLCQPAAPALQILTEPRLRAEVLGADAVHGTGEGHFAACSRGCFPVITVLQRSPEQY